MSKYPYLVQHKKSGKLHLMQHRSVAGRKKDVTFCGWRRSELDWEESSSTIRNAVAEKDLCKICLMSDEVYEIIAEDVKEAMLSLENSK